MVQLCMYMMLIQRLDFFFINMKRQLELGGGGGGEEGHCVCVFYASCMKVAKYFYTSKKVYNI